MPSPWRDRLVIVGDYHLTCKHAYGQVIYEAIASVYWWPWMRSDCVRFALNCVEYQQERPSLSFKLGLAFVTMPQALATP